MSKAKIPSLNLGILTSMLGGRVKANRRANLRITCTNANTNLAVVARDEDRVAGQI